jgi:hypothetical protein
MLGLGTTPGACRGSVAAAAARDVIDLPRFFPLKEFLLCEKKIEERQHWCQKECQ